MVLTNIAIISIVTSLVCSIIIIIDIANDHKQEMKIMNIVWPVSALYSGPIGLYVYFKIGRNKTAMNKMNEHNHDAMQHNKKIKWQSIVKGTLHCGSGCTLGDLIAEAVLLIIPFVIINNSLYNNWLVEYLFAFIIGIIFQYYAIKPMKHLSSWQALMAALKADTLSLTFWQIGMYGWMAIAVFLIFHRILKASDPVFWFMMQIGMLLGFITAYPVNWWLIKKGVKEVM